MGMGRKLDSLLRRSLKSSKLKPLVNLAVSRLAVLKNQRQVRCSQARSDVVQLLNLGHHERALLRVEHVIKEQNMLDVYVMIEGYCNLLLERINLIEQEKVCPDELKEAISSLLYAASRCGDFPELQEIRAVFTSHYGKEFTLRAIELRNNCGVSTRMIQKLSTRMPSLDSRMNALKDIAAEHSLTLQLEEPSSTSEENLHGSQKQQQSGSGKKDANADGLEILPEVKEKVEKISGSMKAKKYKDVADAAQAAFESANYAAEAARAAVELSKFDHDDPRSPSPRRRKLFDNEEVLANITSVGLGFQKVHASGNNGSELGDMEFYKEDQKTDQSAAELKRSVSISSSDSEDGNVNASMMATDVLSKPELVVNEIEFDETDDEGMNEEARVVPACDPSSETKEKSTGKKSSWEITHKQNHTHNRKVPETGSERGLNIENKKPFSVRTRRINVR